MGKGVIVSSIVVIIIIIILLSVILTTKKENPDMDKKTWVIPFNSSRVKIYNKLNVQQIPKGIKFMKVNTLWDKGYKGQGIKVGIIDSGIDRNHPELKNQVIKRRNYIPDKFNGSSEHGTHVAGIIASKGVKILGVAPNCKLLDYRVFNNEKGSNKKAENISGSLRIVIDALNDAVNDGCDIINMSLGVPVNNGSLHNAIIRAVNKGVVVVVAAGNEGSGRNNSIEISYPAFYPEAMAVGAVIVEGNSAYVTNFSNFNKRVNIWADGYQVISTKPKKGYRKMTGTSMSTPHIAGALACYASSIENNKLNLNLSQKFINKHSEPIDRHIKVLKIKNNL